MTGKSMYGIVGAMKPIISVIITAYKFVEEARKYLKFYEAFKRKPLNSREKSAIEESYEKIEAIEKGLS